MVRSLKTGGKWLEKRTRLPGQLWEDDYITTMNDIAKATKTKFAKYGITTVLHMKRLTSEHISVILGDKEFRVSEQKLKNGACPWITEKRITLTCQDTEAHGRTKFGNVAPWQVVYV
jgi:hypothetical protein